MIDIVGKNIFAKSIPGNETLSCSCGSCSGGCKCDPVDQGADEGIRSSSSSVWEYWNELGI